MTDTPSIPGFNVPLALRQLGNNMKLYVKLLDKFEKSYAAAPEEMAGYLKSGDFETAERTAHTIKGLAGSLGASALQEVSFTLEKLFRDKAAGPEVTAAVEAFSTEITAAVEAIRGFLAASAQPAPAVAAAPGVDKAMLASQLANLASHVDESDARALMLFDEMRAHLDAFDAAAAKEIASAFEMFDFTAAADVIVALRQKLGA